MGYQDLLRAIPPILVSQVAITDPLAIPLSSCRISGWNDPTYGAVGYVPPVNGDVWSYIETLSSKEDDEKEPGRIWAWYLFNVFIGIVHADTARNTGDYEGVALSFVDSLRQVVASNRRVFPTSNALYPTSGDVRWTMTETKVQHKKPYLGTPWFGVDCTMRMLVVTTVEYQF